MLMNNRFLRKRHQRVIITKVPSLTNTTNIHSFGFSSLSASKVGTPEDLRVMCVELVANRFLRKMVRVLVATAIREAAAAEERGDKFLLISTTHEAFL
ncbi:uncharacterized protein A4U43_C06F14290 [Asparagus officinalis]|uniref:tRNA pseudouridine synthase n=1 Tax=Asparagus officinalis TaxID=4686 RepID=A0A5P1EPC3_ASPOF|nr:uncharacterized protein A4U43_C06F14290 [Asparagus officinalis]